MAFGVKTVGQPIDKLSKYRWDFWAGVFFQMEMHKYIITLIKYMENSYLCCPTISIQVRFVFE